MKSKHPHLKIKHKKPAEQQVSMEVAVIEKLYKELDALKLLLEKDFKNDTDKNNIT